MSFAIAWRAAGCCLFALLAAVPAWAQNAADPADRLDGTLKKIKASGVVVIGYRADSPPFSFLDPQGRPVGYSLDLCTELVEDIADGLGIDSLNIRLQPVTAENRVAMVVAGEIDIECGSTTSNTVRRRQVAFSPIIFITGTKLLVRRDSEVRSLADLRGRTVAVTRGTTNAQVMQQLSQRRGLGLNLIAGADHAETFGLLAAGRADAMASDEVLLYGLLARTPDHAFRVVGDFLSYEPYALMLRTGDEAFARTIDSGFRRLAMSRELARIHDKWFLRRTPAGAPLGLPMSPQLEQLFRMLGLPGE
jgi:glutamate/aspartate transport system substrate-binding protein